MTLDANESAIATPASSAVRVRKLMKNEASEVGQPEARSEPLAHEVEHRPAGQRGHPAAHLGVDDDPDDADDHDPGQVHPEPRAGLRVGDEVADVDEAADGGQDAEEDGEEPLHPCRATNASRCRGVGPQRCRDADRGREVAPPGGDADVGDVVDGGRRGSHRARRAARRTAGPAAGSRRRCPGPRSRPVLLLADRHHGVGAERLAGRRGRGDEPHRGDRRLRRLGRGHRLALVASSTSAPARPDGPRSSRASTPRTPRPGPSPSTKAASALDARPDPRPNGVGSTRSVVSRSSGVVRVPGGDAA